MDLSVLMSSLKKARITTKKSCYNRNFYKHANYKKCIINLFMKMCIIHKINTKILNAKRTTGLKAKRLIEKILIFRIACIVCFIP